MCHQAATRPEPERIARSEHDSRPSPPRQHRGHVKRYGPGHSPAPGADKRQMPGTAKDNFALIQRSAACGRQ